MKKVLFAISLSVVSLYTNAQSIDLNWSDKQVYENRKDGFFDDFIGGNSKYVYAKYNKAAWKESKQNSKIKLVAYDRNSMSQVAQEAIIGYKENAADKERMKDLTYFDQIVFENTVNIFWLKTEKGKAELYAQVFDSKLNEKVKLKKIYEVKASGKKSDPNLFVIGNKKAGEKIIIGAELPREKSENVKFEYKILKSDLTFDAANQITLPYSTTTSDKYLSASYEIGDDGLLYVNTNIRMDKEERKELSKNESSYYNLLTVVNPSSGKYTSYPLKFDNKNLFDVDYEVTATKTKIYGLYCDLTKDQKGRALHGIFYSEIDNSLNTMSSANFIAFDKATLDKVFSKDKEDRKKAGVLKSKKAKKSDEESIVGDYTIENIQTLDNNSVVLFASRMRNYSVTTCDGKGNCTTRYYCEKRNVTAFKVDNTGKLAWATNLDRSITYGGWNIYDLRVVNKEDKMYVVYGSAFNVDEKKKSKKKSKSKSQRTDKLEYAVFDYKTGAVKRDEYAVNAPNVPKKDKKSVSPLGIDVIDNRMYINSSRVRYKAWHIVVGCVVGAFCPPVAIIPFINGGSRKGTGYVGNIIPLK
ncbi:MAG: hypothetical protein JNM51_10945 [Bacteroidia bacterium]|nr:hypothetical protein [Bacteroidia bacterium]